MGNAMTLTPIAVFAALTGFMLLASFQLALVLGAPLGHLAWGGLHRHLPLRLRLASLAAIVVLMTGGLCVLEVAGIVDVLDQDHRARAVVWGLVGLFGLSLLGNLASSSRAERRMGVPVAGLLMVACLIVAVGL
ncbi:MAG: hypothetical protein D6685_02280 [Bacteroidetes bacterium]|nr:MAG: hypothetical protein D6685_02280 [Bacteroidota bacterium]